MVSIASVTMTDPQPSDNLSVLVAEAQANPAAFAALYDRFVQSVYCYLYRHTGNQPDAEDLTAQTFLTALEALPRYQEKDRFAAWLFTIARSKTMDYFRARKPQVLLELAGARTEEVDLLSRVVQNDEIEQLASLIRVLKKEEQELIRLRYAADLSFAEMAALLGKSKEAVKKSLYRLLARLQSQMEAPHE